MPSPIITATWQAGALNALSNIVAQLITCWQAGKPLSLSLPSLLQFVTFSVIACPPNYIWQSWLEASFPAYAHKLSPRDQESLVDQATMGRSTALEKDANGDVGARRYEAKAMTERTTEARGEDGKEGRKLNLKNTAIKFLLDQTVGAGVNTVLFIIGMALIRGNSFAYALQELSEQFWPIVFAG